MHDDACVNRKKLHADYKSVTVQPYLWAWVKLQQKISRQIIQLTVVGKLDA